MGIQMLLQGVKRESTQFFFLFSTEFQNWVITLVKTNNVAMRA